MAAHFYSPSTGKNWASTSDNPAQKYRDMWPADTIEIPSQPGEGYKWNGSAWIPPTDAEKRAAFRAAASMGKTEFSRAFVAAGLMTHEEAKSAVIGQWPASKDHWLAGMTTEQRQDFELDLAGAQVIHRNYEHLDLIGSNAGITPEQLDAIFGYTG